MIVVDASVLANALGDDGDDGDTARARLLRDPDLHAPELIDLEVLSVLRRRSSAGDLDARRANQALTDLVEIPVLRYEATPFVARIWELRENLTPHDAAYVVLAEALDCALLTADERLARAPGLPCPVELLSVPPAE